MQYMYPYQAAHAKKRLDTGSICIKLKAQPRLNHDATRI